MSWHSGVHDDMKECLDDLKIRLARYDSRELVAEGWRVVWTAKGGGRGCTNVFSPTTGRDLVSAHRDSGHPDARLVRVKTYSVKGGG